MVLNLVPEQALWGSPRKVANSLALQVSLVASVLLSTALMAYLVVRPAEQLRSSSNRVLRLGMLGIGLYIHALIIFRWRFPIPGIIPATSAASPAGQGHDFGDAAARHFGAGFYITVNACRLIVWALVSQPPEPYATLLRLRGEIPERLRQGQAQPPLRTSEPSLPLWMDLMINLQARPRGPRLSVLCAAQCKSFRKERWFFVLKRFSLLALLILATDVIESIVRDPWVYPPAEGWLAAPLSSASQGCFRSLGPFVVGVLFVLEFNLNQLTVFVALSATYALFSTDPDLHPWLQLPEGNLLTATSVTSLWNSHWHQFIRTVLIDAAGRPVKRVAGKAASILACFFLSGLIHEIAASYMSTRSLVDRQAGAAMQFFIFQAALVLFEQVLVRTPLNRAWRGLPRHLTTVLGWTWTYTLLPWSGWVMIDSWYKYGCSAASSSPRFMAVLTAPLVRLLPLPSSAGPIQHPTLVTGHLSFQHL